jgi:hypothetical protein
MKGARVLVPLALALLCSFALAADKEGKGDAKSKPLYGVLSEPAAGGDAKVIAVLKTKIKDEDKSLNVIAGKDELTAQIKELAKKGAKVRVQGEVNADKTSITVSKIAESEGKDAKGGKKGKDAGGQ